MAVKAKKYTKTPKISPPDTESDVIAGLPVHLELTHPFFAVEHGAPQLRDGRIRGLERLGEDGLVDQLGRVGVDEEGAAAADHDAVGVGIGFDGGDRLGKPAQRKVDGNRTDVFPFVFQGLAEGGDHILRVDALGIVVLERLGPYGTVQQLAELVPVHIEILVVGISFLDGLDNSLVVVGIG